MRKCNVQIGNETLSGKLVRKAPNTSRVLFDEAEFNKLPEDIKGTARAKDKAVLVKTDDMAVMEEEKPVKEPKKVEKAATPAAPAAEATATTVVAVIQSDKLLDEQLKEIEDAIAPTLPPESPAAQSIEDKGEEEAAQEGGEDEDNSFEEE